ncbi:MAG TPA: sugar ABC transporter permease [Candidatus Limnocylindria bacterium]|nr:sugar ABC transporter permease [Candidatus Limnocylindria bacterium]
MARTEALPVHRESYAAAWWRTNATALLFMGPAAVLVAVFFIAPVAITFAMSFTDLATSTGLSNWTWNGTANYQRMFRSAFVWTILGNTLVYVSLTLAFNVLVGLGVALLSVHMDQRSGGLFRALWLLPRLSPSVVYALMWTWAAASPPFGMINYLVAPVGLEPRFWLQSDPWLIIILVNGFVGASFGMLVFTSAITAIPQDLFRAARVDGASAWQIVRRITLPLIKWPILFVLIYQTMSLIASYEYILLTTDGGPGLYGTEVWSLWAFHTALTNYYGNLEFGYGAAMAAVLVVMGLVISLVMLRVFRFGQLVAEPKVEVG